LRTLKKSRRTIGVGKEREKRGTPKDGRGAPPHPKGGEEGRLHTRGNGSRSALNSERREITLSNTWKTGGRKKGPLSGNPD